MKKTIVLTAGLLCSILILSAQNHNAQVRNHPPQNVEQTFHNDHPDVKNVNWHQTNGQWHERHQQPDTKVYEDNYYDRKGQHIDTHRQLITKDVPMEVDKHFRDHHHGYSHYRAVRIERPDQPALFQINWTIGGKNRKVYTDEQGNEVKYNDRH